MKNDATSILTSFEAVTSADLKLDSFTLKVLEFAQIDEPLVCRWSQLEQRAVESNAYLSPHFVLSALLHFAPRRKPLFVFVDHHQGGEDHLVGVGVFERVMASPKMPVPHLRAYRSPHSYLTGLLIDRDCIDPVIELFFSYFMHPDAKWSGVEFNARSSGGPLLGSRTRTRGVAHACALV